MNVALKAHGRHVRLDLADPDDHISRRISRRRDFYERDLLEDLHARARGGVAIDVGAHVGNHTVWMAAICGLDVVAIEPNAGSLAQLNRNVAVNDLAGKVRVIAAAAGRAPGFARVEIPNPANTGMARAVLDDAGVVEVVTIDELELDNVSVIKVDVEGSEIEILEGARRTIERCRPLLYVEAQTDEARSRTTAFLAELGYRCFGCYALTPTYGFEPAPEAVEPAAIRVSVAIMAHPARTAFVEQLVDAIDAPVQTCWDELNDRWDTGRRALLAYDPLATHHMVIQDDGVVCQDLVKGVTRALERNPHCPTSLYLGRQRPNGPHFNKVMAQATEVGATWIIGPELCWGVALCFPVGLIEPMVAAGDASTSPNYDKRLSAYLLKQKIPTWYTVPSLVDHRRQEESPSLVPGRTGPNRVAHRFVGSTESALALDWAGGRVVFERRQRKPVARTCPTCGAVNYACGMPALEAEPIEVGL